MPLFLPASIAGIYYLEDDGTPGNNRSRLRDPTGFLSPFDHPADELFFAATAAGVSLIVDLIDPLGTATFRAGDTGYVRLASVEVRNLQTSGRIILDADSMTGGTGNDWYVVRNSTDIVVDQAGGTADRVFAYADWTLGVGQQVEILSTYNQTTSEAIDLTGNALTQTIYGNAGANILDSGGGGDALVGLGGNDTYIVRDAFDRVFETGAGGTIDRVLSHISYILSSAANVDELAAADPDSTNPIDLTGSVFSQSIIGNAGANRLDGKEGFDQLTGGGGPDLFSFTSPLGEFDTIRDFQPGVDKIFVSGVPIGQGTFRIGSAQDPDDRLLYDPVTGRLSYDDDGGGPRIGQAIVFLHGRISANDLQGFTGIAGLWLDGTDAGETLDGAGQDDRLIGNGGDDKLNGGAGSDYLDGGTGNDVMNGGAGDYDWFIVRNSGDLVIEAAGDGIADQAFVFVDWTLGAGQHVERLTIDPSAPSAIGIDITGNELSQTITGNADANILDGGGGGDVLNGGFGGNDIYIVRHASDQIIEIFSGRVGGHDTVRAAIDWTLASNQFIEEMDTVDPLATTAIDLTGNELVQRITGNAGSNRLDGKGGQDTLDGDAGADTYLFTTVFGGDNFARIYFESGIDKIAISGIDPTQLQAGAFALGSAAQDADDRVIYDQATGNLYYDSDGSGAAAQILFAVLNGGPVLTASDFSVI